MTSIYSPKAFLTKQPVAVASAFRQLLLVLVLMGVFDLTPEMVAGIGIMVEAALSLFTWASVVPTVKVTQIPEGGLPQAGDLVVLPPPQPEEPLPAPVPGDAP